MSQQINPIAVKDVVLDLKSEIDFLVLRSGQNISTQRYLATSSSDSMHVYSVQVPSTSTVLSRNLQWHSQVSITLTGNVAPYEFLVNWYPVNQANNDIPVFGGDCLSAFPLSSLCTNMTATINNTSVSVPLNRILNPLLRAIDRTEFEQYNGTTPTQLDTYGKTTDWLPQPILNAGALAEPVISLQKPFIPAWNSPLNGGAYANLNNNQESRNAFYIDSITGNDVGDGADGAVVARTVVITFSVTEPLFLSPFLYGEKSGAGLSGISQINLTMNMDSKATRAINWLLSPTALSTKSVQSVSYLNSYIDVTYYTPKVSDLIPAVIVTPLQSFTNYITPHNGVLADTESYAFTSNSIMLNSYPDKVFIWVEDANKYDPTQGNRISDSYATITNVNITLNNQTGILSGYTQNALYKASVMSGSKQRWSEFSGKIYDSGGSISSVEDVMPSCGSVLMLDFGSVINIGADYLAPGSLSTAQFQIVVTATNNLKREIAPQLNILMMYSGILSSSNGSSSAYTNGLLTKQNVLDASVSNSGLNTQSLKRYVGSGLLDSLKSVAKFVLPVAKNAMSGSDNQYAKMGSQALGALGYGRKNALMSKLY
tara:strand:+ start:1527 stop:3320 length:1794 start_codon:yes stop_codon:yes gene_type:complete